MLQHYMNNLIPMSKSIVKETTLDVLDLDDRSVFKLIILLTVPYF